MDVFAEIFFYSSSIFLTDLQPLYSRFVSAPFASRIFTSSISNCATAERDNVVYWKTNRKIKNDL